MRWRRKEVAGVLAAVTVMAAVLATALVYGPGARPAPAPPAAAVPGSEEDASVAFQSGPDLDGDGKPDAVHHGSEGLQVVGGNHTHLLDFPTPVVAYTVVRLGGEYPVLFAKTAEDKYAAFAFAPGRGLLQILTWPDGQLRGHGELTPEGEIVRTVTAGGAPRQERVKLQLRQLALETAPAVPASAAAPTQGPSAALAAAVEAVAAGRAPINFATPDGAEQFRRQWQGALPADGHALVAQADDVDAGAENGHTVPVVIWVAGDQGVTGLKGTAAFAPGSGGAWQIRQADLQPLTLTVRTWKDAAQHLRTGVTGVKPAPAPFYGGFRFDTDQGRFVVDAISGRVEGE
jgi:hypothetical protein